METAMNEGVVAQLVQGVHRLDVDVQDLKGRVGRLEGRMDRLEMSNNQILEYVKRIAKMLVELPTLDTGYAGLSARVDALEQRVTVLEQ